MHKIRFGGGEEQRAIRHIFRLAQAREERVHFVVGEDGGSLRNGLDMAVLMVPGATALT